MGLLPARLCGFGLGLVVGAEGCYSVKLDGNRGTLGQSIQQRNWPFAGFIWLPILNKGRSSRPAGGGDGRGN